LDFELGPLSLNREPQKRTHRQNNGTVRGRQARPALFRLFRLLQTADCFTRRTKCLRNCGSGTSMEPMAHFTRASSSLPARSYTCKRPAASRCRAVSNWRWPTFEKYPREHEHLNLAAVCQLIQKWLGSLESAHFETEPAHGWQRAQTGAGTAWPLKFEHE